MRTPPHAVRKHVISMFFALGPVSIAIYMMHFLQFVKKKYFFYIKAYNFFKETGSKENERRIKKTGPIISFHSPAHFIEIEGDRTRSTSNQQK